MILQDLEPDYLLPELTYLPLKRYTSMGDRYYYRILDGKMYAYLSFTGFCSKAVPKGIEYHKWLMNRGVYSEVEREEKALFGTLFHIEALKPLRGTDPVHGEGYDLDWLTEEAYKVVDGVKTFVYIYEDGRRKKATNFHMLVPPEWRHMAWKWIKPFKMGLASWFQFLVDRVVRVIGIEVPLAMSDFALAGQLDFVHTAHFNKKEVSAITDIKSFLWGEDDKTDSKAFQKAHQLQLELCKRAWNQNYPEIPVTHVFNFRPINWKKTPTYDWVNQTDSEYAQVSKRLTWNGGKSLTKAEILLNLYEDELRPPKEALDVVGKISHWKQFDHENHILKLNL